MGTIKTIDGDEPRRWTIKCPICKDKAQSEGLYSKGELEEEVVQVVGRSILKLCENCYVLYYRSDIT